MHITSGSNTLLSEITAQKAHDTVYNKGILNLKSLCQAVSGATQLKPTPTTCAVSLPFLSPGIPLVCFLVLLPLNIPWSQISVTWLGVVHFLACLSPQLGSVLYHLFMNHEGGEPVYHTLLKLDVCGICMINTLGKTTSWKLSRFLHRIFALLLLLICLLWEWF